MTTEERCFRKAASIWRGYLEKPEYNAQSPGNFDLGLAVVEAAIANFPNNANKEILDKFEEALVDVLRENYKDSPYFLSASCDYNPCPILSEAAERAGLDMQFPWKTTVLIVEGKKVEAKSGYGSARTIYIPKENDEWEVKA